MTAARLGLTPAEDHPTRVEAILDRVGERVGITALLADLDRSAAVDVETSAETAFTWDDEDSTTTTWWPQGLTTSAESAHSTADLAERTIVLAAWYAKDRSRGPSRAVRVSVLDASDLAAPRYTHLLLVEPRRRGRIGRWQPAHVKVHAGGLVWRDHLLLVTDTWRGLRVFDLRHLVRVNPSPATYGCRYLLPQRTRWLATTGAGQRKLRWSFASLDRGESYGEWLIAGEYARGTGARLIRLPLAPLLEGRVAEAVEVITTDVPSMQGAVRVEGRYWVSASHGARRRGHLWVGGSKGAFRKYPEALPVGPEDLSYDPASGGLWTQTEHPGHRQVLSMPLPPGA